MGELTDTDTDTPPMTTELTDTVSPATPVPPPPSWPGPPRVSARGLLTPPSFTEPTESPPTSPETPMAIAPLDMESPRDTPVPLPLSSPSPGSTKKQPIIY